MNKNLHKEPVSVRYDFDFSVLNDGVDAIVTRNEFRGEGALTQGPVQINQYKIEARNHSIGIKPVPPATTFREIPDDEYKHVIDVVRAFWKASTGAKELCCWIKL